MDNLHPISGAGGSGVTGLLKSNPIGAFLAGMFLLALIIPPRKRKAKIKKYYSKRRKKRAKRSGKLGRYAKLRNPGTKRKTRSGKPLPRAVGMHKAGRTRSGKPLPRSVGTRKAATPAHMVKGSAAAKAYMSRLRSMRKK